MRSATATNNIKKNKTTSKLKRKKGSSKLKIEKSADTKHPGTTLPSKTSLIPYQLLNSGLDQATKTPHLPRLLAQIEMAMKSALEKKQAKAVFAIFDDLNTAGKVSAIGHAVAFWTMREKLTSLTGYDYTTPDLRNAAFEEVIFSKVGYAPETVRRYLLAWEFMLNIRGRVPSDTWELFLNRQMKDLIALGQATREHGSLSKKTLLELAKAPDTSSLRKGIRKEVDQNGQESKALVIRQEKDGSLVAWEGQQCEHLGYLLLDSSPLRDKARARLIRRAGIQVS